MKPEIAKEKCLSHTSGDGMTFLVINHMDTGFKVEAFAILLCLRLY